MDELRKKLERLEQRCIGSHDKSLAFQVRKLMEKVDEIEDWISGVDDVINDLLLRCRGPN